MSKFLWADDVPDDVRAIRVLQALRVQGWNVSRAASSLGAKRTAFQSWISRHLPLLGLEKCPCGRGFVPVKPARAA